MRLLRRLRYIFMLDSATKKRIDTCRDILVGKVPDPKSQVEQITLALIYKFMDDMDNEAVEWGGAPSFFSGDYAKFAWSRLLHPAMSGAEMLLLYSEALATMGNNAYLPDLFRHIFKHAVLPYRDPVTLRSFLKEINGFRYTHSEDLGDAFEYLLLVMDSQGDAGQFRTPRHIIDFIVEIVAPQKHDRVLDPACGSAGFLIAAYKKILRDNAARNPAPSQEGRMVMGGLLTAAERQKLLTNITGYDISPDMVRLSLVNLYLHGFANPQILEYDTLTSDAHWGETFDVILANPPFMTPKGGIRPHQRFAIQAKRSEVLFVDYIAEHLAPQGRAGVIVPEGIIFQSQNAYKALRNMLVDGGFLWAVVSLPAGVFQPYSGVKTSVLLFDRQLARRAEQILFVKLAHDGLDLGAQRRPIDQNDLPAALDMLQTYQRTLQFAAATALAHAVPKATIAANGEYNLSGDRYRNTHEVKSTKYEWVKLGDLCEQILSGGTPSTKNAEYWTGNIPWMTSADIVDLKTITPRKAITQKAIRDSATNLIPKGNVIVVTRVGLGKLVLNDFDVCISQDSQGLILKKEKVSPEFLVYILSERVKEFKHQSQGSTIQGVTKGHLQDIQIPLPPLDAQQRIVAELEGYQKIIDGAKQVVAHWKPEIKVDPAWETVELGEVCELEYGYTETAKENGDARFIRITDIDDNGLLKADEPKFVMLHDENKKYLLKRGDLLVARTGATYGKTLYFDEDVQAIFASYLIKLKFDKNVLHKFYWIFTQSDDYNIQKTGLVQGGGQPQFNGNVLRLIKIPLPPLDKQREIVARIEEEAQIIAANRRLIALYDAKIRAALAAVWGA